MIIRPVKFIENENENKNATGEDTYAGALRAPRAGSPACVFVFVSVLIFVSFNFFLDNTPTLWINVCGYTFLVI